MQHSYNLLCVDVVNFSCFEITMSHWHTGWRNQPFCKYLHPVKKWCTCFKKTNCRCL